MAAEPGTLEAPASPAPPAGAAEAGHWAAGSAGPDAFAARGEAGSSRAPTLRFVAVRPGELDAPPDSPGTEGHGERRAIDRRLHDAAVRATIVNLPLWALIYAGSSLAAAAWMLARAGSAGVLWTAVQVLMIGAVAVLPWWLRRGHAAVMDTRGMRRLVHYTNAAAIGWLMVAPWLALAALHSGAVASLGAVPAPLPDGLGAQLWSGLGVGLGRGSAAVVAASIALAVAGAACLAPMRRTAWWLVALPASPALAVATGAQTWPARLAIALAALLGCGGTWLVLRQAHRAWRETTRTLIEQTERIRELEAERDAAWRADQEKSRFLAIASHDLRQPVHALGLFAATLDKRLAGTAEEPLVRNVMRAIDGLDRSFNAMLDISRLDAGTMEPNMQHFALRDLFRRLHMHFAGQAEVAGLGLRFSPGGKSVRSDPQLLERILGNLVQNAIKYTEHGGIVVVARSTREHVNVEIWDTGAGIGEKDLPRIFDEFYQIGRGERDRARGLGMGLAIVKRLARLLGHGLSVASCKGRGTMFRVSIPIGGLPGIQEAIAPADTVPMTVTEPRMVLVVDDEEPIREGLRVLLEEWGYQTVTAGSATEAEAAVRALDARVDLILSDLHLGDGPDGMDTIDLVRRLCTYEVPAVLVTGDTAPEEIRRITESGLPVLFKPVQPRKLFEALKSVSG